MQTIVRIIVLWFLYGLLHAAEMPSPAESLKVGEKIEYANIVCYELLFSHLPGMV